MKTRTRGTSKTDPLPDGSSGAPPEHPLPDGELLRNVASYSEDEVRRRAYELYLQRNGKAGDAESDWFAAEEGLRRQPP